MKKRIIPLILAFAMVLSFSVYAVQQRDSFTPSLSFSGTTANCSITIMQLYSDIDITLELWSGDTPIDSWSDSGMDSVIISGSCKVTRGQTYTLIATGTIDGEYFESRPVTKTCR